MKLEQKIAKSQKIHCMENWAFVSRGNDIVLGEDTVRSSCVIEWLNCPTYVIFVLFLQNEMILRKKLQSKHFTDSNRLDHFYHLWFIALKNKKTLNNFLSYELLMIFSNWKKRRNMLSHTAKKLLVAVELSIAKTSKCSKCNSQPHRSVSNTNSGRRSLPFSTKPLLSEAYKFSISIWSSTIKSLKSRSKLKRIKKPNERAVLKTECLAVIKRNIVSYLKIEKCLISIWYEKFIAN